MSTQKKSLTSSDGTAVYYETYAAENHAEPIIFLLHGVGGDLDAWQYVRDNLLKKGFSCIAMDIRGHGYSGHPRAFKKYALPCFIEDFKEILEAEKIEKVILAGHSLGAILATHIALNCPEKLEKLVLISSSNVPPPYLRIPVLKHISIALMNALAFVSPPAFHPRHSLYPEGKFHKDYELTGLIRTIWHNSLRSYLLSSKETLMPNLAGRLHEITMPTLIISGDKDSIFPTAISKHIHAEIKNSKFTVIPNGNHVLVLNNIPEVTNALADFIPERK